MSNTENGEKEMQERFCVFCSKQNVFWGNVSNVTQKKCKKKINPPLLTYIFLRFHYLVLHHCAKDNNQLSIISLNVVC